MTELQEARLLGRAIRRWPVPDAEKGKTMDRLYYLRDFAEKESTQLAAAAAIIAAEGQNQKDEHKILDVSVTTRHDRLDAIAADLGLDASFIQAIEGGSDPSVAGDAEIGETTDQPGRAETTISGEA